MRDFLYVKDAVEMTLHFAEGGWGAGGLYNIGSGEANTWLASPGHLRRPRPRAGRRIHRHARRAARQVPVFHPGRYHRKLRANGYARPVTPLAEAVGDYVRNYLVPGKRLGE
jgi:ADP-L-glycero-D-manno-heptose 6-epimerase